MKSIDCDCSDREKILDYIEFYRVGDNIQVSETLEYYLRDSYSIEEIQDFIEKLQDLIK